MLARRALACLARRAFRPASPAAETPRIDPTDVRVHAFVSQGVIKTTRTTPGSIEAGLVAFTEVGNHTSPAISRKSCAGRTSCSRMIWGPLGHYTPTSEWYPPRLSLQRLLGIRAGRTKITFGLYNESAASTRRAFRSVAAVDLPHRSS